MNAAKMHKLRKAAGWSRERLARALAVSHATVFAWESGRRSIPGPASIAIAAVLAEVIPARHPARSLLEAER